MRVALAQAFYGGGLIAAAPLYALVYVDRLGLSLTEVGTIGILGARGRYGGIADLGRGRRSSRRDDGMRIGSVLGVASCVTYAFAPTIGVLWIAAILIGVANASIDIGLPSVMSEQTPLEERASVLAGWNALTGLRGIAAPFIAGGLVGAGFIDLRGGLMLCAVAAGIGAWCTSTPQRKSACPLRRCAGSASIGASAALERSWEGPTWASRPLRKAQARTDESSSGSGRVPLQRHDPVGNTAEGWRPD